MMIEERIRGSGWAKLEEPLKLVREEEFLQTIKEYAELHGWLVYHTFDSRRSNPGFPDLVCLRKGKLYFVEVKSEDGRLTVEQKRWFKEISSDLHGAPEVRGAFVVRPRDWPQIEKMLE